MRSYIVYILNAIRLYSELVVVAEIRSFPYRRLFWKLCYFDRNECLQRWSICGCQQNVCWTDANIILMRLRCEYFLIEWHLTFCTLYINIYIYAAEWHFHCNRASWWSKRYDLNLFFFFLLMIHLNRTSALFAYIYIYVACRCW